VVVFPAAQLGGLLCFDRTVPAAAARDHAPPYPLRRDERTRHEPAPTTESRDAAMPGCESVPMVRASRESIMLSAVAPDVHVKRVYDQADAGDRYRVSIDDVWPRGVSRERARLDEGARASRRATSCVAGSPMTQPGLMSFARDPGELAAHRDRLLALARRAQGGPVTILYAARDREHNNAVVLAELLRDA
jgi:uncharacterized protein YeaO (DUF488 family)